MPTRTQVALSGFPVPPDRRYLEDYSAGDVYEFGAITVSEPEIAAFARQFDP